MKFLIPTAVLISTALALPVLPPNIQHPTLTHHNTSDPDPDHHTHTSPIWSEPSGHTSPHRFNDTNTTTPHNHYTPSQQHITPDDAVKEELEAILAGNSAAKGTGYDSAPKHTEATSQPSYHLPTLTTLGVKSTATNQVGYVQKPAQVFSASARLRQTKTLMQSKPVATHHLRGR